MLHRGLELDGLVVCELAFGVEFVDELLIECVIGEFRFVFVVGIVGIVGLFVFVVEWHFVVLWVFGVGD